MGVGICDLITGPMFAGKSTEILRRLFNDAEVGLKSLYVNHSLDTRSDGPFSTHNPLYKKKLSSESKVEFTDASRLRDIYHLFDRFDVIGIDEAQFFDDLDEVVRELVETHGKKVIVAGLNGDYKRKPFGKLSLLETFADSYTRLYSYCKNCASKSPKLITQAMFTCRIAGNAEGVVDIGGADKYIPTCRACYVELNGRA